MKVPQTFTIDLDDATYLANLPKGRRSEWIRTAIKMQRLGRKEMFEQIEELQETQEVHWAFIQQHHDLWLAWIKAGRPGLATDLEQPGK